MVRLQNRISLGLEVLQYFTTREWHFQNENILRLEESLSEEDRLLSILLKAKQ
jgi:fatty acyl-CoA reductase